MLTGRFIRDVQNGSFAALSQTELTEIVEKEALGGALLTPLLPDEREVLLRYLIHTIGSHYNGDTRRMICEDKLVFLSNEEDAPHKDLPQLSSATLFNLDSPVSDVAKEVLLQQKYPVMTADERIALCLNPERWPKTLLYHANSGFAPEVRPFAYRPLERYMLHPFSGHADQFLGLLERLHRSTRKTDGRLRMLDIGGADGRALHDAKQLDPRLRTYNITPHEEPARWPTDHFRLSGAEAMPADWNEQMDLIVSQLCLLYCVYPDLILKNVVKALSPGGEAFLDFAAVAHHEPMRFHEGEATQRALILRMTDVFRWLETLQQSGFIETDGIPEDWMTLEGWTEPENSAQFRPRSAVIHIRKCQPLGETVASAQRTVQARVAETVPQ